MATRVLAQTVKLAMACILIIGCSDSSKTQPSEPAFSDEPLEVTLQTTGGETLKLDDGSEIVLPEGMFDASTEVVFRRETCNGIFQSDVFGSCLYSVALETTPNERFSVNLVGSSGRLTTQSDGEFKAVGVLNDGKALSSRDFTLRVGDDARCSDTTFSACGGNVVGTWDLVHACGDRSEVLPAYSTFSRERYAACGEGEWIREYPFTTNKTLTFRDSGGYGRTGSFDVKEFRVLTQRCLNIVGETCHETCQLSNGVCECLYDESSGVGAGGGRWAYGTDTSVIFDGPDPLEEESGPGTVNEYCVEGGTLTLKSERGGLFVYQKAE